MLNIRSVYHLGNCENLSLILGMNRSIPSMMLFFVKSQMESVLGSCSQTEKSSIHVVAFRVIKNKLKMHDEHSEDTLLQDFLFLLLRGSF